MVHLSGDRVITLWRKGLLVLFRKLKCLNKKCYESI